MGNLRHRHAGGLPSDQGQDQTREQLMIFLTIYLFNSLNESLYDVCPVYPACGVSSDEIYHLRPHCNRIFLLVNLCSISLKSGAFFLLILLEVVAALSHLFSQPLSLCLLLSPQLTIVLVWVLLVQLFIHIFVGFQIFFCQ